MPSWLLCRRSLDWRIKNRAMSPYKIRLSAFLAASLVLAVSATAQPVPGGQPAVGVVRAERQQIIQTDEFMGRIQAVGRVASLPGSQPSSKSGSSLRDPRSRRAIPSTSSSRPRFRRKSTPTRRPWSS